MVDLVVNASFDFSSSALLDVTRIRFTAGSAVATFDASQFDDIAIRDNLIVRGYSGIGSNGLLINGGGVDASGWTFSLWNRDIDTLTFNGTATADNYTGSSMKDVMFGGQGSDTFNTSDGAGDEFRGEGGKDYFRYSNIVGAITDIIDGGGGTSDRLSVLGAGTFDFTGASIIAVEELRFGAGAQTVILDYDQFYPFLSGSINRITGSGAANTLEIHGSTASFSNITVSNWTDGVDLFRLVGTAGQDLLFGSIYADEIISGGGNDVIGAGQGDDTVEIDAAIDGANIDGELGNDTLRITAPANSNTGLNLRTAAISGFERLSFEGTVGQNIHFESDFLTGNPLTDVFGNEFSNQLHIYGNSVDLNSITFTDWDALNDAIFLYGSGNDHFDTSSLITYDFVYVFGGLADVRVGGARDAVILHEQLDAGSILDGGTSIQYGDELQIDSTAPALLDLSIVSISGFEILQFQNDNAITVITSGAQMGGTSGFTDIAFDGIAVTLNVAGSAVDLSGVNMFQFDAADSIIIDGTAGNDILTGSGEKDIINGDAGSDVITVWGDDRAFGNGGNDTFILPTSLSANAFSGLVYGGGGTADQIITTGFAFLDQATITGVEILKTNGGFIWLRDDQIGGSGFTTVELEIGASIEFFVTGPGIDLSGVSLVNFDTGPIQRFKLFGTEGDDTAIGTSIADELYGSQGADTLDGGDGVDTVDYSHSDLAVTVKLNIASFSGGDAEGDSLSSIENITGSDHNDILIGDGAANVIDGGDGDDQITGVNGADRLRGGQGNDTFIYSSTGVSPAGGLADVIEDFHHDTETDIIRLSGIDAIASTVDIDDEFVFIDQQDFTAEGQVRAIQDGTSTIIQVNTSGNDTAEMEIVLNYVTATMVDSDWFIL